MFYGLKIKSKWANKWDHSKMIVSILENYGLSQELFSEA